ncbi:MAG: glutamyl-tRNA reductase [Cytophagales bacterium]|nr:glutamyl-tRNA reductase [Cytophagales bacterium]
MTANYSLDSFIVIGTNFTKADTQIRSCFALGAPAIKKVYASAKSKGVGDIFVLSTCNRTEFYACASESTLQELLIHQLNLNESDFNTYFYTLTGENALRHFFRVTTGLDSQIIGEYEIVGQVKKAIQLARENNVIGTLTDRISSVAFQASKEVKSKTNLSSGKYSVSYAAAELISEESFGIDPKRILIVGTGELGKAIARNLKEYFPTCELTFTNRTRTQAEELAAEVGAAILPFESFTDHLSSFDAVIAAAQSDHYVIQPVHTVAIPSAIFLDLSIPQIIDPKVKHKTGIKLFSVDEISAFHNELIKQRYLEVPKAQAILEDHIQKLMEWQSIFVHRNIIRIYKERVSDYVSTDAVQTKSIDKGFSRLIQEIKSEGYRGCSVIQTMNEIIAG